MLAEYDDILTVKETCDILMVGKNTIYELIKDNEIEGFRPVHGRTWKIPKESLIAYIRRSCHLSDIPQV